MGKSHGGSEKSEKDGRRARAVSVRESNQVNEMRRGEEGASKGIYLEKESPLLENQSH